jgi:hypothetical protein
MSFAAAIYSSDEQRKLQELKKLNDKIHAQNEEIKILQNQRAELLREADNQNSLSYLCTYINNRIMSYLDSQTKKPN